MPQAVFDVGLETPIQTFYEGKLFDPFRVRSGLCAIPEIPPSGLAPYQGDLGALQLQGAGHAFEVDNTRSFFGDCLNVVDAPSEERLDDSLPPFGWSGTPLLGGYAITKSALTGSLDIQFHIPQDGFIRFDIAHGVGLSGSDSVLSAPDGYTLASACNAVRDAEPVSRGNLDLRSGRVQDFHYNLIFWNTAIARLLELNPSLDPPPLLFPGLPHAGHAMAWFKVNPATQRLELGIVAQQFLPLGPGTAESPIVLPASQSPRSQQSSFHARNSSLHPFIFITAVGPAVPAYAPSVDAIEPSACAPRKILRPPDNQDAVCDVSDLQDRTVRLICLPSDTNFGDDFVLNAGDLGGTAMAQSPLFGHIEVQFGRVVDGQVPFVLTFNAPSEKLKPKFRELLSLLPPGTQEGLIGLRGEMSFPKQTYQQSQLSLTTDPYKVTLGVLDMETGNSAPFVMRKYLFQSVMKCLLMVEPRTPTDSFAYLSSASFSRTAHQHLLLRVTGENYIPYPENYAFPLPNGGATKIGKNSFLRPFVNLFALSADAFVTAHVDLEFSSTKHHRGHFRSGLSLRLRSGCEGAMSIEMRCDQRVFTSLECSATSAVLDKNSVMILEFSVVGKWGKPIACYGVLTILASRAEFQLISVDEHLDCWVSGTLERI